MRTALLALISLGLSFAVLAAPAPYDESADPHAALHAALTQAQSQNKQVLLIFGANWCEDCRDLDKAMHGSSAKLIESRFVVVKVDVGNFDKNLDVAAQYGNPIQKGIPAAVVLTATNQILYSTRAGELADARTMSESRIYDFFVKMAAAHPSR